jgi:hypothetical protein
MLQILASNYCKEYKIYMKGKDIIKKRHKIFNLPNLCGNQLNSTYLLLSLFLLFLVTSFQHLNFEYIGRNSLLGNRKKIAKFLLRTFTCRSTFFYKGSYRPSSQLSCMRGERGGIHFIVMEAWKASCTDTAGMHVQLRVIVNF